MEELTMAQPTKPTEDISREMLDALGQLVDGYVDRGYCPHCLCRMALLHVGVIAAHELQRNEMGRVLKYIGDLSMKHEAFTIAKRCAPLTSNSSD
jgi:hypothetical protein